MASIKGYKRKLRTQLLPLERISIFRIFISKENKKMLPSKYVDSETIRNINDLGCHLIQPSHMNITDEVMGTKEK